MKKLVFATTLLFGTVAYVACNIDSMKNAGINTRSVKEANLISYDVNDDANIIAPMGADRANLGQADYGGNGSGH